jgi:hypothetical protein
MQRGEGAAADLFDRDIKTVNRRLEAIGFLRIGSVCRFSVLWHEAVLRARGERVTHRVGALLGLPDAHSLSKKRRTVECQVRHNVPGAERLHAFLSSLE